MSKIKINDTITTEQRTGNKKRSVNRITQKGTQTNVPEAGGRDISYRKQTGGGRRGKQSEDVLLVSDDDGGKSGRVGISTFGGGMKYKRAEVSPTGDVITKFRNRRRAKRAKKAVEATIKK
tara:strand:- start:1034 stop:1396 length:363 start_codon:yes stop_codon:yes gene_type:complete